MTDLPHKPLTPRQREVVRESALHGRKEAAHRLGVTPSAIAFTFHYLRHQRCGCRNEAEAAIRHSRELDR